MTDIAAFTADTHLAPRTWVKHPGLEGDSYYGFTQVADFCATNKLPLFLAGDILDKTRPDPKTISHINAYLNMLRDCRVPVYYNQGQHELDRNQPWLSAVNKWPVHLHKIQTGIQGVTIYGLDWTAADAVKEEFRQMPRTDVVMMHQVWHDLMGVGEAECSFSEVPFARVLVTGDFHHHKILHVKNLEGGAMTVLSPGPLSMQSIDEDPSKFFFVLKRDLTYYSVPVRTRQCFRFFINTQEELEIFLAGNVETAVIPQKGVPDYIAKNIVHVIYQAELPEVYTRITAAVNNRAHLFLIPVRHKPEVVSVEIERRRALADGGLEACLELIVDRTTTLYRDLLKLLRSQEPQTELEDMRKSFTQGRMNDDNRQLRSVDP